MIWDKLREKAREQQVPVASIAGEVLHLIALEVLFSIPESQIICFQGGTSIHLLYGGYRYSEDLDFAGGEINAQSVKKLMDKSRYSMEKNIIQFLGRGRFRWKYPDDAEGKTVFGYWLNFQPQGMRRVFRIKMEFAGYPVYRVRVIPARSDFDIMQRRPLVNGLTPAELMAEKITAAAGRPYTKARDIFDLWYLSEILEQNLEISLVEKKFKDCDVSWDYDRIKEKIENIKSANMEKEMNRFLPQRYRRQLSRGDYAVIKQSVSAVIENAADALFSCEKQL